ncbi:taste receptor type 2 member 2-like [Mantella aurantiaca]
MADAVRISLMAILTGEFLLGIALNAFIVAAHCLDWRRTKHLPSSDKIVMCLCISRFFLQWAITILNFLRSFSVELYSKPHANEISLVVTMFLNMTSLWMATLLSVFYCVKITTYHLPIFIFLRTRISKLVSWLLCFCLLVSVASSLPLGFFVYTFGYKNTTVKNVTRKTLVVSQNFANQSLIYGVCSSVPFAIFTVAVWLLIHSLWSHTRQMKNSGNAFRSPNMDTHLGVVKNLTVFFFLYIIYFVCMNLMLTGLVPIGSSWIVFASVLISAYPFLHSAILIFTNNKLKKTFLDVANAVVPQRLFSKSS